MARGWWGLPTRVCDSARGVKNAELLINTINATSIHNVAYQNQKFFRSTCEHAIDELPSAMEKGKGVGLITLLTVCVQRLNVT